MSHYSIIYFQCYEKFSKIKKKSKQSGFPLSVVVHSGGEGGGFFYLFNSIFLHMEGEKILTFHVALAIFYHAQKHAMFLF